MLVRVPEVIRGRAAGVLRVPAAAGAARARSGRSACPAPGHCVVTGVVSFHVLGATFNLDPQKWRLSSLPSAQSDETPGRVYLLQPQVWRSSTGDSACRGRTGRSPVRGDAAARRAPCCVATGQRAKHLHEACASVSKLGLLPRWPGRRGWLPAVTPAARDAVVASLYPARSLRCPPSVPVGRECWCRTGPVEISNAGEDEPSSTDWFISRWMFQIIPEVGLVRD